MASAIGTLNDIRLYDNSSNKLDSLCEHHEAEAQRALMHTVDRLYKNCQAFQRFCDTHIGSSSGQQNSILISQRNVTIQTGSACHELNFDASDLDEQDAQQLHSESHRLLQKINRIYQDCMNEYHSDDNLSDDGYHEPHRDYRPEGSNHYHHYYGDDHGGDSFSHNSHYGDSLGRGSYPHSRSRPHGRGGHRYRRFAGERKDIPRHQGLYPRARGGHVKQVESTVEPRSFEGKSNAALMKEPLKNLEHLLRLSNHLDNGTLPPDYTSNSRNYLDALKADHRAQHDQLCHHMYSLYKDKIGPEPGDEAARWNIGRELFLNTNYSGTPVTDKDKALAVRLMVLDQLKPYYPDPRTPKDKLKEVYLQLPQDMRNKIEGYAWQKSHAEPEIEDRHKQAKVAKGHKKERIGKAIMNFGVNIDDKYYVQHGAIEDYIRDILLKKQTCIRKAASYRGYLGSEDSR
jgi:hypothetical protein